MLTDYLNENSGASDVAKKWVIVNEAKTLTAQDSGKCLVSSKIVPTQLPYH